MSLLTVNALSIAFYSREGRTLAVDNVSFNLNAGQILGIVGESGSGKSVCCYSLLGLLPTPPAKRENGTAFFHGDDLFAMTPAQLRRVRGKKIGMIFQDPMTSLTPGMRIIDQLTEVLRLNNKIDKKSAESQAIKSLEEVGIEDAAQRAFGYPHEFSGGMRQRVMIAMALIANPDILIADEPTTALDVTLQAQILNLIADLQRKRNLAVILISHDLSVVAKMADYVLVMKQGAVVEEGATQQLLQHPKTAYTQQLIAAIPRGPKLIQQQLNPTLPTQPVLEVKDLTTCFYRYSGWLGINKIVDVTAVNHVSLQLAPGEILGVVGESGSGKSTLGRSIMQLIKVDSGEVLFEGRALHTLSPQALRPLRKDFQMIFQDPYASLNPRQSVFDILAEPLLLHGLADKHSLAQKIQTLMDDVGLPRAAVRKYPHEFSGGQRQRIAIRRALAVQPKLIIADEPVSALDVTIQQQILELLLHINQKHGLAILFISHDLQVVRKICDRVMVMHRGSIVETGLTEAIFAHPQAEYTRRLLNAVLVSDVLLN